MGLPYGNIVSLERYQVKTGSVFYFDITVIGFE